MHADSPHLTWIGHATFALRLGGKLIVTDPVWSERVGPQRRKATPGVALEKMPRIDVVTVSHSHYDHLDLPTLRRIGKDALYVVPKDVGESCCAGLSARRRARVVGVAPGRRSEDHAACPRSTGRCACRGIATSGCGAASSIESPEGVAYHAGDTAFSERVFREIGERFPAIDWAMLPIGAYDPDVVHERQHMGPEDAVRAFEILGAKTLCAMHWGTFKLTDEPLGEPPARVRAHWAERDRPGTKLHVPDVGETLPLTR